MKYLKRTWAEIDVDALLHNFNTIRQSAPGRLAAVVKADAYGHGASFVAPVLQKAGADMFAVSNIEEAMELRRCGITRPVLILGYTPPEYVRELSEHDIIQTVYSLRYAKGLSEHAVAENRQLKCHIKIDSGMSRLGFDCRDDSLCGFDDILTVAKLPALNVCGAFTHFSSADSTNPSDKDYTDGQYGRFCRACAKLEQAGIRIADKHCCNSAGLMLNSDKHLTMCRPGIIIYGLTPADGLTVPLDLIPAMSFKSTVSLVKKLRKGDCVSYGRHFCANREMTVATVAAGYADGYPRLLSNKGQVLINGRRADILGNVCMDQMMVDVSGIENVHEGTEVTLFGRELPVEELAALCNTINYELICGVSRRVPRIYTSEGREIALVNHLLDK